MGVTRRTVHQAVRGLVEMGRLDQLPDPASARRRPIRGTGEGQGRRTKGSTQVRPGQPQFTRADAGRSGVRWASAPTAPPSRRPPAPRTSVSETAVGLVDTP
ncbi:hypothetical protein ACNFR7_14230 [Streptomyces sp. RM1]